MEESSKSDPKSNESGAAENKNDIVSQSIHPNNNEGLIDKAVDGAKKLWVANQLWVILIVIFSSGGTIANLGRGTGGDLNYNSSTNKATSDEIATVFTVIAISLPLLFILGTIVEAITSYFSNVARKNGTAGFGEAWSATTGMLGSLIGLNIIIMLKVFGGAFLFIVPGIRAALRYSLANMIMLDKKCTIGEAIAISKAATKGRIGKLFLAHLIGIIPIVGSVGVIGAKIRLYDEYIK